MENALALDHISATMGLQAPEAARSVERRTIGGVREFE